MFKPEILFLQQEDVIATGVLDMKKILEDAESTFVMLAENQLKNMMKISMVLPDVEHETAFFNSMPAYIGGDKNIAGIKWAAESRENITNPEMPTGVDITILSDPHTALPVCILDGTIITAMRTSASAGVAAKYLTRKGTRKASFAGAGIIGRTMVMAMMESVPELEEIEIFDLDFTKADELSREFDGNGYNVCVKAVDNYEASVRQADLVVTMTSARKPFLKKEWLKTNATVIQMGPNEIEADIITGCDRLITDKWETLKTLDISNVGRLYKAGGLKDEDTTDLQCVITGSAEGRRNDDELVLYCSLGMGAMDLVISERLYREAKERGIGTKLVLWDKPIWI